MENLPVLPELGFFFERIGAFFLYWLSFLTGSFFVLYVFNFFSSGFKFSETVSAVKTGKLSNTVLLISLLVALYLAFGKIIQLTLP